MNDQPWQDNFILGNWLNLQRPAVRSDCKMRFFCLFWSLLELIISEDRIYVQAATKRSAVIYDGKLITRLFSTGLCKHLTHRHITEEGSRVNTSDQFKTSSTTRYCENGVLKLVVLIFAFSEIFPEIPDFKSRLAPSDTL